MNGRATILWTGLGLVPSTKGKKGKKGTVESCMDMTDSMLSTLVNRKALDMGSFIRPRRLNLANFAF